MWPASRDLNRELQKTFSSVFVRKIGQARLNVYFQVVQLSDQNRSGCHCLNPTDPTVGHALAFSQPAPFVTNQQEQGLLLQTHLTLAQSLQFAHNVQRIVVFQKHPLYMDVEGLAQGVQYNVAGCQQTDSALLSRCSIHHHTKEFAEL